MTVIWLILNDRLRMLYIHAELVSESLNAWCAKLAVEPSFSPMLDMIERITQVYKNLYSTQLDVARCGTANGQ